MNPMVEGIHERPAGTPLLFRDEYSGETLDFVEALVNTCGANFTLEQALETIRDLLIANSAAVHRLIWLRPKCAASYWRQHVVAEEALKRQIIALKIHGVIDAQKAENL